MGRKHTTIATIRSRIIAPEIIFLFPPVINLKNMIFPLITCV